MDIRGKNVLVLGAYGQVGEAVCKLLLKESPARIVVASLRKDEALRSQQELEFLRPDKSIEIIPAWGNMFVRDELKDIHPREVYANPQRRHQLLTDTFEDLDEAANIACNAMLDTIMNDYSVSRQVALALASVVVDLRVTQIVNGVKGVHAVLPHGAVF